MLYAGARNIGFFIPAGRCFRAGGCGDFAGFYAVVSPVHVGDGAYIAAGSTVTEDVPEDALGIARARQTNIEGWAAKKGLYRKK